MCFLFFILLFMLLFFFFSSRRRHTRLTCDWSSDVCSSDLGKTTVTILLASALAEAGHDVAILDTDPQQTATRSEEHTSELQSHVNLVCRLLLEKKKKENTNPLHSNEKISTYDCMLMKINGT